MSKIDGGLRVLFKEKLKQFHWQPIENAGTGDGVPDANYCGMGAEGWVEFKATANDSVKFRPAQPGWIIRRTRKGGRVWIAVRQQTDILWLIPGHIVVQVDDRGLGHVSSHPDVCVWASGQRQWPWGAIADRLAGPVPTWRPNTDLLEGCQHDPEPGAVG